MRRIMITAIAGTLALTACSETPTEVTDEDIANIEQTLMHGSELSWELTRLETRIGRMCMEDKGFDVHDDNALHGSVTPGRFTGFNAPYARIPTVEQAEQFAFGEWIRWGDSPDAESMSNDPDYLAFTADDDGWWDPAWDESRKEWDKADEEYQRAWEEAFIGAERMAYEEEASKLLEEAMENGEDIGEIDIASRPPFGGCELETIEAVYGGPTEVESDDGTYWSRPSTESPLVEFGDGDYAGLSAEYADEEQAFLDCVAERGYGEWEFDDIGWLPTGEYLYQAYPEAMATFGIGEGVPELTDDAEDRIETEGAQAFEFAMALDFAQCAEASGLRDGSEEYWAREHVEKIIDHEAEIYAWQEDIEQYVANAQEALAG